MLRQQFKSLFSVMPQQCLKYFFSGINDQIFKNRFNSNLYKIPDNVSFLEYIWIDGTGLDLRSKTLILQHKLEDISQIKNWTFDGSSTGQAITSDSEVILKPVYIVKDPLRQESNSYLVLCETYKSDNTTPATFNFRSTTKKIFEETQHLTPAFGLEQEFFVMEKIGTNLEFPYGFPVGNFPSPQGRYYCSVGYGKAFGRAFIEAVARLSQYAGLDITGINAEVAPGQWEFQIGKTFGLKAADNMILARYLIARVGEEFGLQPNFHPKPIKQDFNGSGCHINFSTSETMSEGGLEKIHEYIEKLQKKHREHIHVYGLDNALRLTGKHETASMDSFTFGVGHRGASIRIPIGTNQAKKGYLEDRRPASNVDPYLALGILLDTTCLNSKYTSELIHQFDQSIKFDQQSH